MKTKPKRSMYSAVKTSSTSLAESEGLHFLLEAVDGQAAYNCLGKAVPQSDGVREEGLLVNGVLAYGTRNFMLWPRTDRWHDEISTR